MSKFVVIGGQYEAYCYGTADTLIGAKRMASKNEEYWDNWQGWHTPKIYAEEDTQEVSSICSRSGVTIGPKPFAVPVAEKVNGKWQAGEPRW